MTKSLSLLMKERKLSGQKHGVADERVLRKWKVFDFILTKEAFYYEGRGNPPIFFNKIEFYEGGNCTSIYGEELISGDHMQVWISYRLLCFCQRL